MEITLTKINEDTLTRYQSALARRQTIDQIANQIIAEAMMHFLCGAQHGIERAREITK